MPYAAHAAAFPGVADENCLVSVPKFWRGDGTRRGMIDLRGGSTGNWLTDVGWATYIAEQLEVPCMTADWGSPTGPGLYGNDTLLSHVDAGWDLLKTTYGCRIDKLLITAWSRGFADASNWARANPTKIAAIVTSAPVINADQIHDDDIAGQKAIIESAYGGLAGWDAAEPTRNPWRFAEQLAHVPQKIWYSTDDPICLPAWTIDWATRSGAELISNGPIGHTTALAGGDALAFFRRYDGAAAEDRRQDRVAAGLERDVDRLRRFVRTNRYVDGSFALGPLGRSFDFDAEVREYEAIQTADVYVAAGLENLPDVFTETDPV